MQQIHTTQEIVGCFMVVFAMLVLYVLWCLYENRRTTRLTQEALAANERKRMKEQVRSGIAADRINSNDPRAMPQGPSAASLFGELLTMLFSHPRTHHCPCANCRIADLHDIVD